MVAEYLSSFYMIPVISQVSSYDIFIDRVKQSIQSAFSATVIPAQAGIQFVIRFRTADIAEFFGVVPLRGESSIIWIPACAGMTEWEVSRVVSNDENHQ